MAPRVLVIDNYDSFVYNLVQYLGELGAEPVVHRSDAFTLDDIEAMAPDAVLISPGPGRPEDAGLSNEVITTFAGRVPILGVCLGHQCIGQVYGGEVVQAPTIMHGKTSPILHEGGGVFAGRRPVLGVCLGHQCIGQVFGGIVSRAPEIMHGKTSLIRHTNTGVFTGLPDPLEATRYHSLIVERDSVPDVLEITAETDDGIVMGLRHRTYDIEGVQFHPESILTVGGHDLLRRFLDRARVRA